MYFPTKPVFHSSVGGDDKTSDALKLKSLGKSACLERFVFNV